VAYRAAAEQARSEAITAQLAAIEASAAVLFPERLAGLDGELDAADRERAAGLYDLAASRYGDLVASYGALARRSADAVSRGGLEAVAARDRMRRELQAALDAGARERAPLRLTSAQIYASQARTEFSAGNYPEAAGLFRQAERAYAELRAALTDPRAASAESRVNEEPSLGSEAAAEAVPAGPASAEVIIAQMIDRFAELFAQEDLPGIGKELYRGRVPREEARSLRDIFERAEDMWVTRVDRELAVEGTSATAEVHLQMRFVQSGTGLAGERGLGVEMRFASGPDGWRLVRLRVGR
jgi:hypothetical protein